MAMRIVFSYFMKAIIISNLSVQGLHHTAQSVTKTVLQLQFSQKQKPIQRQKYRKQASLGLGNLLMIGQPRC